MRFRDFIFLIYIAATVYTRHGLETRHSDIKKKKKSQPEWLNFCGAIRQADLFCTHTRTTHCTQSRDDSAVLSRFSAKRRDRREQERDNSNKSEGCRRGTIKGMIRERLERWHVYCPSNEVIYAIVSEYKSFISFPRANKNNTYTNAAEAIATGAVIFGAARNSAVYIYSDERLMAAFVY